jgi:hypothetical protein
MLVTSSSALRPLSSAPVRSSRLPERGQESASMPFEARPALRLASAESTTIFDCFGTVIQTGDWPARSARRMFWLATRRNQ